MWFKFCWFVFLIVLILSSCTEKNQEQILILDNSYGNKAVLVIKNESANSATFTLNINDKFPLTEERFLNEIKILTDSLHEPLYEVAWQYIAENTKHNTPITQEMWIHNPEIFLNSIGLGFCDDRAIVLAKTWKNLGYKVRIYGLNGHVVPEIFIKNKWQMYDPDHGVCYFNDKGKVASVEELGENVDYFYNNKSLIFDELSDLSINSQFLIEKYKTKKDNLVNEIYLDNEDEKLDFMFELPPNAKLSFPVYLLYNEGVFYKTTKALEFTLYPHEEAQYFKSPFVIYSIKYADSTVFLDNKKNFNQDNIEFSNIKDSVKIYCLLNPKLEFFNNKYNEIKIEGINIKGLGVDFREEENIDMYNSFLLENNTLIFDEKYEIKSPLFKSFDKKYLLLLQDLEEKYQIDLTGKKENFAEQIKYIKKVLDNENISISNNQYFISKGYSFIYLLCLTNNEKQLPSLLKQINEK